MNDQVCWPSGPEPPRLALDFLQTKGTLSNDEAVGEFLNKRPLVLPSSLEIRKGIVLLEFPRAMDTNEDFQSITEKRKTSHYALHCEFIASVLHSYTSSDHDERGVLILKTTCGP
jgi:hypothetical protein